MKSVRNVDTVSNSQASAHLFGANDALDTAGLAVWDEPCADGVADAPDRMLKACFGVERLKRRGAELACRQDGRHEVSARVHQ